MKNFKKNQVIIFVAALMLITAGYLNFSNESSNNKNLLPTSSLADSEQMASIGDATLVNANQAEENNNLEETNANNSDSENNNKNTSILENGTDKNAIDSNKEVQNNYFHADSEQTNSEQNNENVTKDTTEANINTNQTNIKDEYFEQSRLDRDSMYSQMLENYQKILETSNLSNEEKELAQTEIKRINDEKNAIMIAENLIKTKEFEDVVIFVNNGNVSVIVKTKKLEENQISQIQNILTRELNVKVNKINVSNKK